ncbi:hypothetical protein ABZ816_00025 [Actinosynnema sp. NPDC047251]|uniref:Resolvase/invertase-type recombinase catalytic domain-containing protein n=1 Tax=Saccharothrix espanaensis (strain ATCC 51144 / DSM 44229 / JCM 9112 / NBRC 15066 / NRRL 15764) TaxID=1179773 RepID=K0JX69_SACES|nr:hypothetical protein [Saccharothrix espanaensis]CCH30636.1 hypothetical protein BN6_33340 [Saccharothrix espanaensis DSM 44229]
MPWHKRPQAPALLRHIAANAHLVDAVVVGEYERAFLDTDQVRALRAFLEHFRVRLWLPEADGPVEFDNPLRTKPCSPSWPRGHKRRWCAPGTES